MEAMQQYRQQSGRMFPTWSEVLEVFVALGYRKKSGHSNVHLTAATGTEKRTLPYFKFVQSKREVTHGVN